MSDIFVRNACAGCRSENLIQFLDLGTSPLANTPSNDQQNDKRYPLRLGVCDECSLVQMLDVVVDDVIFNDNYTFYSSTSPALEKYHAEMASDLFLKYDLLQQLVIEIGSNDGSLLHHFSQRGFNVLGVEPAAGPAQKAEERGITTVQKPFTNVVASEICDTYGRARLVIAKNVAAHIAHPIDFFSGIHTLLAPNGVAVIEVQYLADLLLGNQFDQAYHEHRFFYSVSSLSMIGRIAGLSLIDVEHTEPQGGSIRVTFARAGAYKTSGRVHRIMNNESWLHDYATYKTIQPRVDRIADRLVDLLVKERKYGRIVAGYGAPAKATTLVNFCGVDSTHVQFITDLTAAKQGTFLPGTDIPIVDPNDRPAEPDTYLMLAWNYASSIIKRETSFMSRGGKFIVPLPVPTTL